MPRLTKEEKLAQRAAQEAEWSRQEAERHAAYLLSVPKRMKTLADKLNKLGLGHRITLADHGPCLSIDGIDEVVSSLLDRNEFEWVEQQIEDKLEYQAYALARENLARSAFNKLTNEEKDALKEYIHLCR